MCACNTCTLHKTTCGIQVKLNPFLGSANCGSGQPQLMQQGHDLSWQMCLLFGVVVNVKYYLFISPITYFLNHLAAHSHITPPHWISQRPPEHERTLPCPPLQLLICGHGWHKTPSHIWPAGCQERASDSTKEQRGRSRTRNNGQGDRQCKALVKGCRERTRARGCVSSQEKGHTSRDSARATAKS